MAACEHLFVYGTLMSSSSDAMGQAARSRLFGEATRVAAASAPGRLVDLGAYPGFIRDDCAATLVHGELLRLRDPDLTFAWLDVYEGIDPGPGAANEYLREVSLVYLGDGSRVAAWLYRFALDAARFPLIASGRWSDRTAS